MNLRWRPEKEADPWRNESEVLEEREEMGRKSREGNSWHNQGGAPKGYFTGWLIGLLVA